MFNSKRTGNSDICEISLLYSYYLKTHVRNIISSRRKEYKINYAKKKKEKRKTGRKTERKKPANRRREERGRKNQNVS
jgi:hypothetical protein